jgi:hypothetical protein
VGGEAQFLRSSRGTSSSSEALRLGWEDDEMVGHN